MSKKNLLHQAKHIIKNDGSIVQLLPGQRKCPVCGTQDGGIKRWSFECYDMVVCRNCGVMHLTPLPNIESLEHIYSNNYFNDQDQLHGYADYAAQESLLRRTFARRLALIRQEMIRSDSWPPQHVLEIGCALGFGLAEVQTLGNFQLFGADISPQAIEVCRQKGFQVSLATVNGCVPEIKDRNSLDLIYMFDVIEHIIDIKTFLDWAFIHLTEKGFLVVTTPDMKSLENRLLGRRTPSIKIPQHLTLFDIDTLQKAFAPHFILVRHWRDFQMVGLNTIWNRLRHIFGRAPKHEVQSERGIWFINGMRLFLFRATSQETHKPLSIQTPSAYNNSLGIRAL
ncbi:MAG: class I SAM-dependent methyltransferase [Magnetococcus sp. DMHC-6]